MSKIFEDYEPVDCLKCQHYWHDTCDGPCEGATKLCTAFLATKGVDIPRQIESLRSEVKDLKTEIIFLAISLAMMGLYILCTMA